MIYFSLLVFGISSTISLTMKQPLDGRSVRGQQEVRLWGFFAIAVILIIGLRYQVGTDYGTYAEFYERFQAGRNVSAVEWGYATLNRLSVLLGFEFWFVMLLSAALTNFIVLKYLSEESQYLWLSVLILFGIGFFFRQMNQVRQVAALSLTFYSTRYIIQHRFVPFFAVCLLATGFHVTAVVMLPMYWLARVRWSQILLGIVGFVGIIAFITPLGDWLMESTLPFITPAAYSHYVTRVLTSEGYVDSGTRIIFESVVFIPLGVWLLRRYRNDERMMVYLNLLVFGFISQAFLAPYWAAHRVPVYFLIYQAIVIPEVLRTISLPNRDKVFIGIFIVAYFLTFVLMSISGNSHRILPYQSLLFA